MNISTLLFIIGLSALIASAIVATSFIIFGYEITTGDYCSSSEDWLNVTHVEYCIFQGEGIQCSEPEEQLECQKIDKLLESLGQ